MGAPPMGCPCPLCFVPCLLVKAPAGFYIPPAPALVTTDQLNDDALPPGQRLKRQASLAMALPLEALPQTNAQKSICIFDMDICNRHQDCAL